jgi:hypothetical protein
MVCVSSRTNSVENKSRAIINSAEK